MEYALGKRYRDKQTTKRIHIIFFIRILLFLRETQAVADMNQTTACRIQITLSERIALMPVSSSGFSKCDKDEYHILIKLLFAFDKSRPEMDRRLAGLLIQIRKIFAKTNKIAAVHNAVTGAVGPGKDFGSGFPGFFIQIC